MKRLIAGLSLICLSQAAVAEFPVGKVGVRVSPAVDIEVDGLPDGDGSGFGFHGELGGDRLFAYADHQTSDLEISNVDLDIDETRLGVGVRGGNETGTLNARVERYDVTLDYPGGEDDDQGMGVHVGGELSLGGSGASVFGSVGFLSLDDSDGTEFQLGLSGEVSEAVELFGAVRKLNFEDDLSSDETDVTDFRIGLNLLF